jgi:uncharacterized protein YqeY
MAQQTSGPLKARLSECVKDAMRSGDKPRLATLRYLSSAIKQREIDDRIELDDRGVLAVFSKLAKQHRESIKHFSDAGRQDLVDKEAAELAVIESFLPKQLDDAEIDVLIAEAIADSGAAGPSDMGKVMGRLKTRLAGRADLAKVSARVKARLERG